MTTENENCTIEECHNGSYRAWCDCCPGDRWHRYVYTNPHGIPVYECTECWATLAEPDHFDRRDLGQFDPSDR